MDGWIHGYIDRWMDGYIDRWMDGYMDTWRVRTDLYATAVLRSSVL